MDKAIYKYIKDGISINGNPEKGYEVFTISTQYFKIKSLDELTPERFKIELNKQKEIEEKLFSYNKQIKNCNFFDPSLGLCSNKKNESHKCTAICVNYED